MSYKVAILGHSQVPPIFPDIPGTDIRVFRKPGAHLRLVHEYPDFSSVFSWEHHHNIIFLGGNDIDIYPRAPTAEDLATQLIDLCRHFHALGQTNHLCEIEPRQYSHPPLQSAYNKIQHNVNRRLVRYARNNGHLYMPMHFNTRLYSEGHGRDGVHFTYTIKEHITDKMVHAIMYARERYDTSQ